MAIMNRCCCCDVRVGSIVISIWSMIAGGSLFIENVIKWADIDDLLIDDNPSTFIALYCVSTIFAGFLLLSGICLMIGVIRSNKFLLLPYVLSQSVSILLYFILMIIIIVLIINGNMAYFNFFNAAKPDGSTTVADYFSALKVFYGIVAGVIFLLILINTLCVLCVISLFQQLRDCCTGDRAGLVVNQGGYGNQPYYPGKC